MRERITLPIFDKGRRALLTCFVNRLLETKTRTSHIRRARMHKIHFDHRGLLRVQKTNYMKRMLLLEQ
jgi:hypothetical protein